jgi:hypothetical protein
MATYRSSSKNTGKINLLPIFNKNSPRAHTESEFDVLGFHRKLVKYSLHPKLLECFDWNTNIKEFVKKL